MTNNHTFSENKWFFKHGSLKAKQCVYLMKKVTFYFFNTIDNKHKMDKTYYTLLNKLNVGT